MLVAVYLTSLVLFSAPFWYLSREFGFTFYTALLMWAPAAAALLTNRLFRKNEVDLGLARFPWRTVLAAYMTMAWILIVAHVSLYTAGVATFPDPQYLVNRSIALGLEGCAPAIVVGCYFALVATAGVLNYSSNALGEEIGWRGFLFPELYKRLGFTGATLVSGSLWAVWHYPLLIGRSDSVGIVNFTLMVIGLSFLYSWFRIKAASLWPAVLTHGTHNALLSLFFLRLTTADRGNHVWLDETGYGLAAAGVATGIFFWSIRSRALTTA